MNKIKKTTSRLLHNCLVPFSLLLNESMSTKTQDSIYKFIMSNSLLESLPPSNEVEIQIKNKVSAGTTLAKAHKIWQQGYFTKIETPINLPRQPELATCPFGIVRVEIDCIEKKNPGMGSYYGFTGYYLSVLVLVSFFSKKIWDARGEHAT